MRQHNLIACRPRNTLRRPPPVRGFGPRGVPRRTGKSLLAAGSLDERRVVFKALLAPDPFWRTKWHHEIGVYRIFAENPPPVRVPRLVHTDGEQILVLDAHPDTHYLGYVKYHPDSKGDRRLAPTPPPFRAGDTVYLTGKLVAATPATMVSMFVWSTLASTI